MGDALCDTHGLQVPFHVPHTKKGLKATSSAVYTGSEPHTFNSITYTTCLVAWLLQGGEADQGPGEDDASHGQEPPGRGNASQSLYNQT